MKRTSLCTWTLYAKAVQTLSPAGWRKQSIYFLVTDRFARSDNSTTAACDVSQRQYCGGSWQGITNQLNYIQGMGFTAVWITPVTGQFYEPTEDGASYHGYWQQNIYELNHEFGTAEDLKKLSNSLHARGMYLMVDVVANHMGYNGAGTSVDYAVFTPFNSHDYFHSYCLITNYSNQTDVEDCWLGDTVVSLPDLNTDRTDVQSIWYNWVSSLVSNYSSTPIPPPSHFRRIQAPCQADSVAVDGLRIDTAKHVQKSFWPGYQQAAGVYCLGEVLHGDPAYTCAYQDVLDGVLNYPVYYPLLRAFRSPAGSMRDIYMMVHAVATACADPTLLGTFVENHDNTRFASYTADYALAKNALAFLFFADGIPIVYAGQEQHYHGSGDPYNREAVWLAGYATTAELYTFIQQTNRIRRSLLLLVAAAGWVAAPNDAFYHDAHTLAMRKGSLDAAGSPVLTVLTNAGASAGASTLTLNGTGYAPGTILVEAYTCTSLHVDTQGDLVVPMTAGLPRVFVPMSWAGSSELCKTELSETTTVTSGTVTTAADPPGACTTAANLILSPHGMCENRQQ
ncbi:alpha-amylase precursor [Niveomyces insectorum RCEF 264]|uniref:Alpha-amylase n=1 Tax=Niveomyces insectorum RCEF 264 TaxID=1081102 RepID=A0A167VMV1_9HYPO|nr:alpha-amylase precursor [Niveomyces insectorum RCEF 264]